MKHTYKLIFFFFTLAAAQVVFGQGREARLRQKGYINPEEIVSIDSTYSIDEALGVLDTMSEKFVGKIIDYPGTHTAKIGVQILNQHWHDALEEILKRNGLWYKEEARFIRIIPAEGEVKGGLAPTTAGGGGGGKTEERLPTLDSRDVKISAVFFVVNVSRAQNYGISWNFYRPPKTNNEPTLGGYVSAGLSRADSLLVGPSRPTGPISDAMAAGISAPQFTFGNIDALIKFFGNNNLGEVTTSPEVVVRDGKPGRIQVGTTIYITTKDIAGNTIQQPVETGTIVDVTPTVYSQSDTDFVWLNLKIEQSTVEPGPVVSKNAVTTHTLLYDGEETVIGGLVTSTETEVREGVPFLKDLPWWFFGLRYVFGSESKTKLKQELVILLKAELLQPIRQRISERALHEKENLIQKKRKEFEMEYDKK